MRTVRSKEQLEDALKQGEKYLKVTDEKLLKALAVKLWIQNNKVKGTALLAAIGGTATVATVASGGTAPAAMAISAGVVAKAVGVGLTIGGVTIGVAEIIAIAISIRLLMTHKQEVESVEFKNCVVKFK